MKSLFLPKNEQNIARISALNVRKRHILGVWKLFDSPVPSFGISVNPIWTKGADYARHITTGPPIFLDDAAALHDNIIEGFHG